MLDYIIAEEVKIFEKEVKLKFFAGKYEPLLASASNIIFSWTSFTVP